MSGPPSNHRPLAAAPAGTAVLRLEFVPASPISPAVASARRQRALVVELGGGRGADAVNAKPPAAPRRAVAPGETDLPRAGRARISPDGPSAPGSATDSASLHGALVVPPGAVVRGYLRCRALLLAGQVAGNVHCTAGPVVVRAGGRLAGRLVAAGDVYVRGAVGDPGDAGGGVVIATTGRLVLAPGARVDGDVRCARLERHEGAVLNGVARPAED